MGPSSGALRQRCALLTLLLALLGLLPGCATRLPDQAIDHVDPEQGYRLERVLRQAVRNDPETLLLVAFSGGGTRAAAFAYGVLEELRDTPVSIGGRPQRMLDQVDAISSVSGGSFTALAYALYGDKIFETFEQRFLKRDVQGDLLTQVFDPLNWPSLLFTSYNRSDLAARYYDEILFDGATFGDLTRRPGPLVVASATDFSTGARFTFTQATFDLICTDLSTFRLSLAATASSAVPVVFDPVTLRNRGGDCGLRLPDWFMNPGTLAGSDALLLRMRLESMLQLNDGTKRPWLHLVDGGVSDNLGLRAIMDLLQVIRLRKDIRQQLGVEKVSRVALIVVNSLSASPPDWSDSPSGPGIIQTILQAASVPIDRNSTDAIVMMQSMFERWKLEGELGRLDPALLSGPPPPSIEFYPIILNFDGIPDAADRAFFNSLPTSLWLPESTIDRLRAAARSLLRGSADYQRFLKSVGRASPD
jgi:NTE family protein